jgi:general secretion pathway protein I
MKRSRGSEQGFTLIEVLIAMVILTIAALSLMRMSGKMIRSVTDDRVRTLASASVDARIAEIRSWPTYSTLDTKYAGTEANTPLAGLSRVTTVVRTGGTGQVNDYRRITVTVSGTGLSSAVTRTITMAAQ